MAAGLLLLPSVERFGGVFELMFKTFLEILDTENLNLDGTHSLVKKSAESVAYQPRKKGKTSNILMMTDGKGIPISIGYILEGNHHDLFEIVPQFSKMIRSLKDCGIHVQNSILNADTGFNGNMLSGHVIED